MRYEFKYIVPMVQLGQLRSMIRPFMKQDSFAMESEGSYTVRSIYFDTPNFEMYHTKQDGIAHRLKVRLRGYNLGSPSSPVFMEIKRKYEGPILKNRATTSYEKILDIFKGGSFDDNMAGNKRIDDARRFFYQIYSKSLQPVINVIYEREPFLSLFDDGPNGFRVTLDKNLRSVPWPQIDTLFDEYKIEYANPNYFILEVKFNHYCPTWIKPVMASLELKKEPASKYVMCIDSQRFINVSRGLEPLFKGHFLSKV